MSKIEEKVEEVIQNSLIARRQSVEVVDVEYVKEKDWYLRIYIDKEKGVGLDDCQKFSEAIGKLLDKMDPPILDGSYILEVSSPGLDRLLKKERDFKRESGKMVDVTFYAPVDGQKQITAALVGLETDEEGKNNLILKGFEPIAMSKVASVRLHIDF